MKTALIIVNVQKDYLSGGVKEIKDAEKILPFIQDLNTDGPTFAVRNWFDDYFCHLSYGLENTPGAKLHPAIKKMANYTISVRNPGYSGFQGTTLRPIETLEDLLLEHEVQHVTVCGLGDSVVFTALDSAALGYQTRIAKDASIFVNDLLSFFISNSGIQYG
jgi:nicotinamidase-related amidase